MKKCYKITTIETGVSGRHSAIITKDRKNFYVMGVRCRTSYKIGEWTKARKKLIGFGYGLFVFTNKAEAIKWVKTLFFYGVTCHELWECEVRGLSRTLPENEFFPHSFPKGTAIASEVQLTNKIASYRKGEKL